MNPEFVCQFNISFEPVIYLSEPHFATLYNGGGYIEPKGIVVRTKDI